MGNALSRTYDSVDYVYDKYYPKQKWLQPVYVTSGIMLSKLVYSILFHKTPQGCRFENSVFLFSFGTHLGVQIWVTFISGMTMMRLLPRHQFGLVQSKLFPKYFFITTAFSFASLCSYMKMKPFITWEKTIFSLGNLLLGSFLLNFVNFTCFNINTIKYNVKMHQIEKSAGEGITTVGKLIQESKVEGDPEYVEAKRKFYKFHGLSSLFNFANLISTVGQLYFLSERSLF